MKERPILFNGAMVRAILGGTKTQTRRVLKEPDNGVTTTIEDGVALGITDRDEWVPRTCPYGQPGDRLWVREACMAYELSDEEARNFNQDGDWDEEHPPYGLDGVKYMADGAFIRIENSMEAAERWGAFRGPGGPKTSFKWKPSIYMPRWACRIELELTSVRLERLQEICPGDIAAEGYPGPSQPPVWPCRKWFSELWDSINAKKHPWQSNPWVWALTFRRI